MTTGKKPPRGFAGVMLAHGWHVGTGRTAYACGTCGLESQETPEVESMRLSLIIVHRRNADETMDGSLLQNKMAGSVEEAVDKIEIAVVPEVAGRPLDCYMRLKPLAVV